MNCEAARAAIIDELADSIDESARSTLERHLAGCAACRAEAADVRALWSDLGRLNVAEPAPESAERIRGAIVDAPATASTPGAGRRNRALERDNGRRPALLAASIALLVGLAAGWFARDLSGMSGDDAPAAIASEPGDLQRYLILLHGPPAAPPGSPPASESAVAAAVARYTAWADTLRSRGRLVVAEKLNDETGRWLAAPGDTVTHATDIGGFYLIRAGSYEEAEAIARTGPHIGYGGTIELRAIEHTGG